MIWTKTLKFRDLSWNKPIVYGWFRGDVCLYIGMSVQGLCRPLSKHHILNRSLTIRRDDKLCWIEYPTEAHARVMERFLIRNLQPKFNNGKGESFRQALKQLKLAAAADVA